MKHADSGHLALWCPASIERALIDWFFVRVNTELDHTKRYSAAYEDVASAI